MNAAVVRCHYFLPGPRLPSHFQSITAAINSYWLMKQGRHMSDVMVKDLPTVAGW